MYKNWNGTHEPSEDRNGDRGDPERTGADRLRLGTERTGFTRSNG